MKFSQNFQLRKLYAVISGYLLLKNPFSSRNLSGRKSSSSAGGLRSALLEKARFLAAQAQAVCQYGNPAGWL